MGYRNSSLCYRDKVEPKLYIMPKGAYSTLEDTGRLADKDLLAIYKLQDIY